MGKEARKGAKQRVIEHFLRELKKLGVNPEYTLSDKDWSEINAFRAVWPKAKHQLCFWHTLRAIKKRLAKPKETPTPYDVDRAHHEFSFIKETFVPAAQQNDHSKVHLGNWDKKRTCELPPVSIMFSPSPPALSGIWTPILGSQS